MTMSTNPERQINETSGRIERAVETYKQGEAALHNQIGNRIYSDQEHGKRVGTLRDALKAEIERANNLADEVVKAAEGEILQLKNADPLDSLTPEQLQVANAKRPFIAEDADSTPLHQLTDRLEAVLATDDPVAKVLWSRYVGRRVERERANGSKSDDLNILGRMLTDAAGGADVAPMRARIDAARKMRMQAHRARMDTFAVEEELERGRAAYARQRVI